MSPGVRRPLSSNLPGRMINWEVQVEFSNPPSTEAVFSKVSFMLRSFVIEKVDGSQAH